MIEFDGIRFNDVVSKQLIACLGSHDASHGNLTHDQIANRVTRPIFMAAVAEINGLSFLPKLAEFCEPSLLEKCDPAILTREGFTPSLC